MSSAEKFPQENSPRSLTTSHHRVPLRPSGPLAPGHSSSSLSERLSAQKPTVGESGDSISPQQGARTHSQSYKNTDSKPAAFCRSELFAATRCSDYFNCGTFRWCAKLFVPPKNEFGCFYSFCQHGSCWLSASRCCSLSPVFALCPIEKECDLNKHCRLWDPERKKLSSREPICNVHIVYCWSLLTHSLCCISCLI